MKMSRLIGSMTLCLLLANVSPALAAVTLVSSGTETDGTVYRYQVDGAGNWSADGTFATGLSFPSALAFDGTYVYVGEQNVGGRILRYSLGGTLLGTVATEGQDFTGNPEALAVAPDGSLVMTVAFGTDSDRVYRINNPTGAATFDTLISGLDNPRGVAVDGAGNIYFAERNANRIVKMSSTGTILETSGAIHEPNALHINGTDMYVSLNTGGVAHLSNDLTITGETVGNGFSTIHTPFNHVHLDMEVINGEVYYTNWTQGDVRRIEGLGNLDQTIVATGIERAGHIVVIPEPASLLLIGAGGLLMLRRRRSTN